MPQLDVHESALLVACPEAEPAVREQRARYDFAARDGIPAHLTVLYPFRPADQLTDVEHARLDELLAGFPSFTVQGSTTASFGEVVSYVALDEPGPFVRLIETVTRAFPDWPPYGGVHDEVVPHLTIGHNQPRELLLAAERQVRERLPFTQAVDHVQLWAGPAVAGRTEPASWRHVRSYPLGLAAS